MPKTDDRTEELRALKNIPISMVEWAPPATDKDGKPKEGETGEFGRDDFHPAARIEKGDDFTCTKAAAARLKKLGYAK